MQTSGMLALAATLVVALQLVAAGGAAPNNGPAPPPGASPANNATKNVVGKGYGGGYGDHHDHKRIYSPFPYVKPYYDSHYCSVHGSFALAIHHKVDSGYEGHERSDTYNDLGGGYFPPRRHDKYLRKVTRQYCRYAAAFSDRACEFCCRTVARSPYTNPDDIISAVFAFDPADPAAGGAGVHGYDDRYEHDHHDNRGYGDNYRRNRRQAPPGTAPQETGQTFDAAPVAVNPPAEPAVPQTDSEIVPIGDLANSNVDPNWTNGVPPEQQPPAADYDHNANYVKQCVCCAPKHRNY